MGLYWVWLGSRGAIKNGGDAFVGGFECGILHCCRGGTWGYIGFVIIVSKKGDFYEFQSKIVDFGLETGCASRGYLGAKLGSYWVWFGFDLQAEVRR